MSDLIDRQAAIDALMAWEEDSIWDEECLKHRGEPFWVAPSDVVEQLPSAQPERKTGKWEQDNPFTKPRCSECGEPCFGLHGFDYTLTPYCPNCGADMRGET